MQNAAGFLPVVSATMKRPGGKGLPGRGSWRGVRGKVVRSAYFYALAGVVAALVLASGAFQIARTKQELVSIYESSARSLADGVEQLITQALSMLEISDQGATDAAKAFALDDILIDYLAGLAADLDRTVLSQPPGEVRVKDPEVSLRVVGRAAAKTLGEGLVTDTIRSLESGTETVAIRRVPPRVERSGRLVVVFRRHLGDGFFVFTVEDADRYGLLKRLLVQDVVRLFRDRRDLLDLVITDENGRLLGRIQDEGASRVPLPAPARQGHGGPQGEVVLTRHGDIPALDFTRDLQFRGKGVGALRVSISVLPMEKLISEGRRWTILLGAVLFVVGFGLVRLILWRQERTLLRMQEMEQEIRRREELSALGEMAAGVAHEIRNPLNAISMGLQSLSLGGDEAGDEGATGLLETMRREVTRINRIVSDFLAVSRPLSVRLDPVNLGDVVEHVAGLLRQAAAEEAVEVRTEVPPTSAYLSGDGDKLTQALLNLGINALEACNTEGVVTMRLVSQKGRARIEVSDTGAGVAPEHRPHLFRPHFTTKEKGLGLGLFIAQRIVEAHGGTLALGECSKRGTTMLVTLPVGEG
jgi:signal transduction histidine kinase